MLRQCVVELLQKGALSLKTHTHTAATGRAGLCGELSSLLLSQQHHVTFQSAK